MDSNLNNCWDMRKQVIFGTYYKATTEGTYLAANDALDCQCAAGWRVHQEFAGTELLLHLLCRQR